MKFNHLDFFELVVLNRLPSVNHVQHNFISYVME